MLLQYGPINLNLISVDSYERQAVMHGPNYLGTKHRIAVTATFNPAVQSDSLLNDQNLTKFDRQAGGNLLDAGGNALTFVPKVGNTLPNPVGPLLPTAAGLPSLGSSPSGGVIPAATRLTGAYTSTALKHELMQPRQSLVLSMGGTVLLQSPLPGLAVDVSNGPTPISCDVTKMMGPRTFKVRFVIETTVNDAPLRGSGSSGTNYLHAVLSHRWSMRHDLNTDFFVRRVIAGRLVFRSDVLDNLLFNPDDFRRYFFHPIPSGFKREDVRVKALDDQVTVDYEVVDRQLPVGWDEAGVTRVRGTHRILLTKPNPEKVIADTTIKALYKTADILSRGNVLEDLELELHEVAASVALATAASVEISYNLLPQMVHQVHVEVDGSPESSRQALRTFAFDIISARLQAVINNGLALAGVEYDVQDTFTEKHVELTLTVTTGPVKTLGLLTSGSFQTDINTLMGPDDSTAPFLTDSNSAGLGTTPGGPFDDGLGRGSYLVVCVAGALTGDAARGEQAEFLPPVPPRRADEGNITTTDF